MNLEGTSILLEVEKLSMVFKTPKKVIELVSIANNFLEPFESEEWASMRLMIF